MSSITPAAAGGAKRNTLMGAGPARDRRESKGKNDFKANTYVSSARTGAARGGGLTATKAPVIMTMQKSYKVLLLGSSEAGKSTLMKQMIKIYLSAYWTDTRRLSYLPQIHENILVNMHLLIGYVRNHHSHAGRNTIPKWDLAMEEAALAVANTRPEEVTGVPLFVIKTKLTPLLKSDIVEHILHYFGGHDMTPIWEHIRTLWPTAPIQAAYAHRSELNLTDSCKYFFDNLHKVTHDEYVPTFNDVVRACHRTDGLVEGFFEVDAQNQFHIYDLGGSKNQRKKWIHCYEDVDAVVFVAAISEYDQLMTEDDNTNRLFDSLSLFEEVMANRWFRNSTKILLFTKNDIFAEKFQHTPITVCFEDYTPEDKGKDTADNAAEYIREQFESRFNASANAINSYFVNALDPIQSGNVLNAIKAAILHEAGTKEAGLTSDPVEGEE